MNNNVLEANLIFKTNKDNQKIAFVVITKDGTLRGVGADRKCRKKVVVLSEEINAEELIPRITYECKLIEMRSGKGYICKEAKAIKYEATMEVNYLAKILYQIIIRWGKNKFLFDLKDGRKETARDITATKQFLLSRSNIKDLDATVMAFEDAAIKLKRSMEEDLTPSQLLCH